MTSFISKEAFERHMANKEAKQGSVDITLSYKLNPDASQKITAQLRAALMMAGITRDNSNIH